MLHLELAVSCCPGKEACLILAPVKCLGVHVACLCLERDLVVECRNLSDSNISQWDIPPL